MEKLSVKCFCLAALFSVTQKKLSFEFNCVKKVGCPAPSPDMKICILTYVPQHFRSCFHEENEYPFYFSLIIFKQKWANNSEHSCRHIYDFLFEKKMHCVTDNKT